MKNNELKDKTVLELALRLGEITKEKNKLEATMCQLNSAISELDAEYNAIVYELWDRIPTLQDDVNMQPKTKIKEKKF